MAAYAALASLWTMMDQLQQHTFPPVSLDEQQVESLTEIVTFLQEFLEGYNSPIEEEVDPLESRIADVACAIRAAIESYIAHVILLRQFIDEKAKSGEEIVFVEHIDSGEEIGTDSGEEADSGDETDFGEETGSDDKTDSGEEISGGDETDSGEEISGGHETGSQEGVGSGDETCFGEEDDSNDETDSGEETGSGDKTDFGEEINRGDETDSREGVGSGDETGFGDEIGIGDETDSGEGGGSRTISGDEVDGGDEIDSGEVLVFGKTKISVKEMDLGEEINCINFYQDLQQVIEEMHFIKMEVMRTVKEKSVQVQNQPTRNAPTQKKSMVGVDHVQNSTTVVCEDVSHEIMNKLTRGGRYRQVIPITGMGGIGKTTFAKYIYEQPLIKEHFDICAWATISQQYSIKEILCEILSQAKNEELSKISEDEVGLALYKNLSGRRYLIIMDDMWSIEAWEKIQHFFPNDTNSRILVTTRLSKLASHLDSNYSLEMKFLDVVSSWNLFSKIVFEEKTCPRELEEIGKRIVENCRGLPLSIVVTGGVLKKMEHIEECWESVKNKLSSLVNLENDKQCLKILKMSYDHLPAYLKPCFLYMGVFEEDYGIHVSKLIRLWVYEGFVKPTSGNKLETIALQYFNELVSRNLILVHKLGFAGNIKYCKIHDLLRDFCLKEAEKERFYDVIGQYSPQCECSTPTKYFPQDVIQIMNLRYFYAYRPWMPKIPSFMNLLWNLCALIIIDVKENAITFEIWKMPQLRHVKFCREGIHLSEPPSSSNNMIMDNLQTLKGVSNFKCSEEVVKRFTNIKKLGITYKHARLRSDGGDRYYLSNLECLCRLEALYYEIQSGSCDYLGKLTFPHSLKKLTIRACDKYGAFTSFCLDEVLEKIGSLPLLQKLSVTGGWFRSHKWEIGEGQFPSLLYLSLQSCSGLECWSLDVSSMPRLEHLYFSALFQLKEIPLEIGEISTLKSIRFSFATERVLKSLKKMVEQQEELNGELPFHIEGSGDAKDPELLHWGFLGIEITPSLQCRIM